MSDKSFDELFDNSGLKQILKIGRSLSKEECRGVYRYMLEKKPKTMFEFGVQFGCSTRAFIDMAKWANIDLNLHSWDIADELNESKCIRRDQFNFHIKDVTGKEEHIFNKHNPDFVFLDAHPYVLTKNLIEICLKRRIDFMAHDIAQFIGLQRTCERTNGFTDLSIKTNANWELYLLGVLINTQLWHKDYYENDDLEVKCIRDYCGLAIIKFKR